MSVGSFMARRGETAWIEALSAACALGWAVYVALSPEDLSFLPVYDVLSQYVPDDAWVLVATSCGLGQAFALVLYRQPPRFAMAFVALVWWKVLCVSMFASGQSTPAAMIICIIALSNVRPIVVFRPGHRLAVR